MGADPSLKLARDGRSILGSIARTIMHSIRLQEQTIDSQHVITSPDVPGFLIAHADLRTARNDVGPALSAMQAVAARIAARASDAR